MKLPLLICAISLSLTAPIFSAKKQEFVIQLNDPEYQKGVLTTESGGVITAPNLRIQAKKIIYINTEDEQVILAEGDLMMEYQGKIYVGDKLQYDLSNKTGFLEKGRSKEGSWFVGGDWIELLPDGNFRIYGAFLTTNSSQTRPWAIVAESATICDGSLLKARNVRFQAMDIPLLWIPYYKTDLLRFRDSPIRYRLQWDKDLNLRISMRYRFYSTETFAAFARFDYRFKKNLGPGGALEADYLSKDKLTVFQTKNYGALDKEFSDENGNIRYRFQGIYKTRSKDDYTRFHMQWDKLSDLRMISDFKDPDFEINTQKTTYLELSHYKTNLFTEVSIRPKINPFQSLNQEIPYTVLGLHPFEIGNTGVMMENYASGSYLDYAYAKVLNKSLRNTASGRLQTKNTLYRPFSFSGVSVTPQAGVVAIWYSNGPFHQHNIDQFLYTYGADANMRLSKVYPGFKHTVIPYANYLGYSKPHARVDDYFVFDIYDGYDQLNQLRFGIRQLFFSQENSIFLPATSIDLYAYSFWKADSFTQTIPKLFADIEWNRQSYAFWTSLCWNLQENVLDYGNAELLWTLSSRFAFGIEYRHRSQFWWRKAVHQNFIVDVARPLDELLPSPLSDRRDTFLTKAHIRFSPRWNMQLQTFHGWGRKHEPGYNGAKVDFFTMLTGNWQMRLTYEYQPNDPYRFSYSFKLIK